MRTLLTVLTCLFLLPVAAEAQDLADLLGAAAAQTLAKQGLDVPQASIDRFDPNRLNSRSIGFHRVDATYMTSRATDCRLASAMWIMAISSTAGEQGAWGEWTGSVECSRHTVDLRMELSPGASRWWLSQYDMNGNRIYRASNQ